MQLPGERHSQRADPSFSIRYRIVGDATLRPTIRSGRTCPFSIRYRIVGDATNPRAFPAGGWYRFQYPLSDRR